METCFGNYETRIFSKSQRNHAKFIENQESKFLRSTQSHLSLCLFDLRGEDLRMSFCWQQQLGDGNVFCDNGTKVKNVRDLGMRLKWFELYFSVFNPFLGRLSSGAFVAMGPCFSFWPCALGGRSRKCCCATFVGCLFNWMPQLSDIGGPYDMVAHFMTWGNYREQVWSGHELWPWLQKGGTALKATTGVNVWPKQLEIHKMFSGPFFQGDELSLKLNQYEYRI